MRIVSIDLGNSMGWCYKNGEDEESGHEKTNGLVEWGDLIKRLLTTWKPDIVVVGQVNNFGFWYASRAALLQAGVVFYLSGKMGTPAIELNDSSARKAVFGKALNKKEVQMKHPEVHGDELDAIILCRGWHQLNEIK